MRGKIMKALISASLINKLKPKEKEYDVRDTKTEGFLIRVLPSGKMRCVAQYARGRRINVGKVGVMKPEDARGKTADIIRDYEKDIDSKTADLKAKGILDEHVLKRVKTLKCDDTRVRYLSTAETEKLFEVLCQREETVKASRARANEWRKKRG